MLRLALTHGALATSSIVRRSWGPNLHHLIDPRTGRPAATDVVQASVWADTCVDAEVQRESIAPAWGSRARGSRGDAGARGRLGRDQHAGRRLTGSTPKTDQPAGVDPR